MTTNNKIKLVTHNGSFHSDDIFASAVLALVLEKEGKDFEIIRTRDEEVIKNGDYVYDVGGIYDPEQNRFDHHQKGGAGRRLLGGLEVEYASIGLVWKKFGIELCGDEKAVEIIEKKLIAPIDAGDNGMSIFDRKYELAPYLVQSLFGSFVSTWNEGEEKLDEQFLKCVEIAKEVLKREIIQAKDCVLAITMVRDIYEKSEDKRLLVLDKNYPEETLREYEETLFVIYPRIDGCYGIRAVRDNSISFKNKKDFPLSWAGLRDEELQKVTGVHDAVFCHRGLFLSVSNSKEGAIKLAQIALE